MRHGRGPAWEVAGLIPTSTGRVQLPHMSGLYVAHGRAAFLLSQAKDLIYRATMPCGFSLSAGL